MAPAGARLMAVAEIMVAAALIVLLVDVALTVWLLMPRLRAHWRRHDTQEIPLPPTMRVGPRIRLDKWAGKPVTRTERGESWNDGSDGW